MLMFGQQQTRATTLSQVAYNSSSYSAHPQAKPAELQDFVETNLTATAANLKFDYDNHTTSHRFSISDPVWLTVPTAGKLDL